MACGCGCNGSPGGCSDTLPVFSLRGLPAGQLGQLYCATGDCAKGTAAVQQMDTVFQNADVNTQAQFQSAHDGIMSAFNDQSTWYQMLIPFNTACCALLQLGQQATALTAQMQSAMGQTPVTPPPSSVGSADWTLPLLLVGGAILVGVFLRR